MQRFLQKWLKLQPEEIGVFLWVAAVLFLIRTSNLVFNNFAETAFLKRFGVEYLPMVYMANAVTTFLIMGAMAGVMRRVGSARLLAFTLFSCGGLIACLRLPVYMHFELIYPVLFLLKAQFEALLPLLFWNLGNDLFNTRQSKRIFPLIAAGGVLGAISGSLLTPQLAKLIYMDNLMLAYLGTTAMAAMVTLRLDFLFPTLPVSDKRSKGKKRASIIAEIRNIWPMLKESTLIKILVMLTFLPNVIIPIMNYQFNFAVNSAFGTEQGMIQFFGYFRAFQNVISLVILLFVGKLYHHWGLPVALMFHPVNYLLAFMAFLLRFDIISAMYARVSTVVIRQTINNPARDILMGLFPQEWRALVRPFLRGTVVRVGTLLGSGIIMISEGLFAPRYLAIIGGLLTLGWIASSMWLKRAYSDILLDLVSRNVVDVRTLEGDELARLFRDRGAQTRLVDACLRAEGQACVLYAEMMKSQQVPQADEHILTLIQARDEDTVRELLPLISPDAAEEAIEIFERLIDEDQPELQEALAGAAARFPRDVSGEFLRRMLETNEEPAVQAQAVSGLYMDDPNRYDEMIQAWLTSDDPAHRRAGALAAGGSGQRQYLNPLKALLNRETEPKVVGAVLLALERLKDPELEHLLPQLLTKDPEMVPLELLRQLKVDDPQVVRSLIQLLDNQDPALRELASIKLKQAPELDLGQVIAGLASPRRGVREGLYEVMESLKISDREIVEFARGELEVAYRMLGLARRVDTLEEAPERDILAQHLRQKKDERVRRVLRVLASQDSSGQMRIVLRGLASKDSRLYSNALEALEDQVGRALADVMLPLLEQQQESDTLATGRKAFDLEPEPKEAGPLLLKLLQQEQWITQYLALAMGLRTGGLDIDAELRGKLMDSDNRHVWVLAGLLRAAQAKPGEMEAKMVAEATNLTDKIVLMRGMEIFRGLTVNELAAVATLTEQEVCPPGDAIIKEGEVGETMYLIISGKVRVIKHNDDGCDVDLAEMAGGDYFGEMALFDDETRSASVVAKEETQLLVLHKQEFYEAVREYPQVAMQMCRELSKRLRDLHQKIQHMPVCF